MKSLVFDCEGRWVVVLVPGDRVISWPKLRGVLGVDAALAVDSVA